MSLLERLHACLAHDASRFTPLRIGGVAYGNVRADVAAALAEHATVFGWVDGSLTLLAEAYAQRTSDFHRVLLELRSRGLVREWWGEACPVTRSWDEPPVMEVERGAIDPFGFRGFGVHLNGYVRTPAGIELWVARRARDKPSFPGALDHLAAGGQPLGLSLTENMVKELEEEAGVPPSLGRSMVPCGPISYRCELEHGLNDDTIYVFDLELDEAFEPSNEDGEVDRFERWPIARVLERMRATADFKFNVAPVILDFCLRHDLLPRDDAEFGAVHEAVTSMRREQHASG